MLFIKEKHMLYKRLINMITENSELLQGLSPMEKKLFHELKEKRHYTKDSIRWAGEMT